MMRSGRVIPDHLAGLHEEIRDRLERFSQTIWNYSIRLSFNAQCNGSGRYRLPTSAIEFSLAATQSVATRAYQRCLSEWTSRVLKCYPVAGEWLTEGVEMFQERVSDVRQKCVCKRIRRDFSEVGRTV